MFPLQRKFRALVIEKYAIPGGRGMALHTSIGSHELLKRPFVIIRVTGYAFERCVHKEGLASLFYVAFFTEDGTMSSG